MLPKADYGMDAPYIVMELSIIGLLFCITSLLWFTYLFIGLLLLTLAFLMFYSSKIGKCRQRDILINSFNIKEGNCWRYQVIDSSSLKIIDTVSITIGFSNDRYSGLIGYNFYMNDFNNVINDTGQIYCDEQFISYTGISSDFNNLILFPQCYLQLPLVVNNYWQDIYSKAEYKVIKYIPNFKVLDSSYNVYSVSLYLMSMEEHGYYTIDTLYINPEIGIVCQKSNHGEFPIKLKFNSNLIDYKLY